MVDSVHNGERTSEKLVSQAHHAYATQMLSGDVQGISSIETLLLNIQGLLKVAAENARHHERQINFEKGTVQYCMYTLGKIELIYVVDYDGLWSFTVIVNHFLLLKPYAYELVIKEH